MFHVKHLFVRTHVLFYAILISTKEALCLPSTSCPKRQGRKEDAMTPIQSLKMFEASRLRALWNEDEEE